MNYTFISGATGGLGKAFCETCAQRGYNLFITGRSELKLQTLKEELLKINPNIKIDYFACELDKGSSRAKMSEYISNNDYYFDRILLVAGVDTQKAFCDYTLEKLLFQLRVNAEATTALAYELLKRKTEKCELLAISSMSGVSPMPYFAIYSATKSMIINLFTALHYELKKDGVKVTVVMPGGIPTRPDIIEDIKCQGLWGKLSSLPPKTVAEKSLKALKKNKVKYIPGGFNKFLNFIMKLAPQKVKLKFIANRWSKQTKDAF